MVHQRAARKRSCAACQSIRSQKRSKWLHEEFTHIRKGEVDWLVAAHRAMVLFPASSEAAASMGRSVVSGRLRYVIVEKFVEKFVVTYVGVAWRESLSSSRPDSGRKRRFWRNIRPTTIPVLQHFARNPRNPETGKPLATLQALQVWFADHRDIGDTAWTD